MQTRNFLQRPENHRDQTNSWVTDLSTSSRWGVAQTYLHHIHTDTYNSDTGRLLEPKDPMLECVPSGRLRVEAASGSNRGKTVMPFNNA